MRGDGILAAAFAGLALAGCYQKMRDQPRCEPLGPSRLFADGRCSREPVPGTVARGGARDPLAALDAKSDRLPLPLSAALLARGHERYDIYCSPCHDRVGTGGGMVVQRGYTAPPSFHADRLREAPVGHFVDVMIHGWGAMPPYVAQVPPADRWAIAAYIRALQRSQHARLEDVPPEERARLAAEPPPS